MNDATQTEANRQTFLEDTRADKLDHAARRIRRRMRHERRLLGRYRLNDRQRSNINAERDRLASLLELCDILVAQAEGYEINADTYHSAVQAIANAI